MFANHRHSPMSPNTDEETFTFRFVTLTYFFTIISFDGKQGLDIPEVNYPDMLADTDNRSYKTIVMFHKKKMNPRTKSEGKNKK